MRILRFMVVVGVLVSTPLTARAADVNGSFRVIDGIRVLHVWGTHFEMGYAHGYLLAADIVTLFDEVFVPLVGGGAEFERNIDKFRERYTMPAWHADEVRGIVDGIAAAGVSLRAESLGRDLNVDDFATMDALSDIRTLYECASFSAWGAATETDAILQGESALARNLDWWTPTGKPYLLARNTVVIGREPDDARATLMVGFSGLSGCYSCMNDAGVATTRMMTNHHTSAGQMDFSRPFTPLNMVMRDALEAADVDGDDASTVNDVATALEAAARSSAYNIMIVGRADAGVEPTVVEINNRQFARRVAADDPELPATVLGATNHMRKMYPPIPDSRYSAMKADIENWNGVVSLSRFWDVLQSMYDVWLTGATTQSMVFVPFHRSLAIAYTDADNLAPFKEPVWLAWDDIFETPEADDDEDEDDDDWRPPQDDDADLPPSAADDDDEVGDGNDDGDDDRSGCGC